MDTLGRLLGRLASLWWALTAAALAIVGAIKTVRDAHQPGWFWFFLATVPLVVGLGREVVTLRRKFDREGQELRGAARRVFSELQSMERDLRRMRGFKRGHAFGELPNSVWTVESVRLASGVETSAPMGETPSLYARVAAAYLLADEFVKDIRAFEAQGQGGRIDTIADEWIDTVLAAVRDAMAALRAFMQPEPRRPRFVRERVSIVRGWRGRREA